MDSRRALQMESAGVVCYLPKRLGDIGPIKMTHTSTHFHTNAAYTLRTNPRSATTGFQVGTQATAQNLDFLTLMGDITRDGDDAVAFIVRIFTVCICRGVASGTTNRGSDPDCRSVDSSVGTAAPEAGDDDPPTSLTWSIDTSRSLRPEGDSTRALPGLAPSANGKALPRRALAAPLASPVALAAPPLPVAGTKC